MTVYIICVEWFVKIICLCCYLPGLVWQKFVASYVSTYRVSGYVLFCFKFGSDRQKYTSQIWFEEGFGILRCGHFINCNHFLLNQWCAPSMIQFANIQKNFWKKEFKCTKCKATFIKFFQNFWLFYAFLVRMTTCTLHINWFPSHQEPKWPQWPQQPQQPQWPQWPLQPHFIKKPLI